MALRVERRTTDLEVPGSTPTRALLHNNLTQVVYTLVPLLPNSISWYRSKNREGNGSRPYGNRVERRTRKSQNCERAMITNGSPFFTHKDNNENNTATYSFHFNGGILKLGFESVVVLLKAAEFGRGSFQL